MQSKTGFLKNIYYLSLLQTMIIWSPFWLLAHGSLKPLGPQSVSFYDKYINTEDDCYGIRDAPAQLQNGSWLPEGWHFQPYFLSPGRRNALRITASYFISQASKKPPKPDWRASGFWTPERSSEDDKQWDSMGARHLKQLLHLACSQVVAFT